MAYVKVKLSLLDAGSWLLFFIMKTSVLSNCLEQARHCDSSGNNTIISLDDSAPDLVPNLLIATTMEPKIPTTISWHLGEYLALLEPWIPEIWGYYLCPCKLRNI